MILHENIYNIETLESHYDSIEEIKINDLDTPLWKIKNLKIKDKIKNNNPIKSFKGPKFIFTFDLFFFHQTVENNAQYDLIRTIIPNIEPVFCDIDYKASYQWNENPYIFNKGIYDIYKNDAEDSFIYSLLDFNLHFEEVYMFMSQKRHVYPNDFNYGKNGWWQLPGIKHMRQRLFPLLKKDSIYPKKLYISRADATKRHTDELGLLIKENRLEEHKEAISFHKQRSFLKEELIENYYKNQGYISVCFEGMSYLEQLNYIHNAETIVTLVGSALISCFSAQEGCKLIVIYVDKDYFMNYLFLAEAFNLKFIEIDLREVSHDDNLMINALKNIDPLHKYT